MANLRRHHIITLLGFFLILANCNSSESQYKYTFKEGNDTPMALGETLFQAIRMNDQALWDNYRLTDDEIKTLKENGRYASWDEKRMAQVDKYLNGALEEIRSSLATNHGVVKPEEMMFLRSYVKPRSNYSSESIMIDFLYQGNYLGVLKIDFFEQVENGWKIGLLHGSDQGDVSVEGFRIVL